MLVLKQFYPIGIKSISERLQIVSYTLSILFILLTLMTGCYSFDNDEAQYPYNFLLLEKDACTDDVQCAEGFICDREMYEYVGKCISIIRVEKDYVQSTK